MNSKSFSFFTGLNFVAFLFFTTSCTKYSNEPDDPNQSETTMDSLIPPEDDDSNPALGKYYKSATNLPWGMHVPVLFDYTLEKSAIIKGHLVFDTWVMSGGYSYMNWYEDKPGFRDGGFLYQH